MRQTNTNQNKAESRVRSTSGGWIPPTEEQHSGANQAGFTLIEAVIALVIMLVVALGSASLFSFSVYNNSGGTDRATSLAIAQQTIERLRSAQFNSTTTDPTLNAGTTVQAGIIRDNRSFTLTLEVDDNPSTLAIDINPATNLKSIKVTVRPQAVGQGWAFGAGGTITLFTQRSRTDR